MVFLLYNDIADKLLQLASDGSPADSSSFPACDVEVPGGENQGTKGIHPLRKVPCSVVAMNLCKTAEMGVKQLQQLYDCLLKHCTATGLIPQS